MNGLKIKVSCVSWLHGVFSLVFDGTWFYGTREFCPQQLMVGVKLGIYFTNHCLVESAAVLSTLYGRFIEVWRQKDSIVQRNRMTRLLIRNAGHEGMICRKCQIDPGC